MSSAIENALFSNRGTHGVVEFDLLPGCIRLRVAPWEGPRTSVQGVFNNARFSSLDEYADKGDDLDLPWDIVAFDCKEQPNGRWEFVLHCFAVEWCFESDWPIIEHNQAEPSDSDVTLDG